MSLEYVADGGSLAEEVISTVRTAQAFGTQKTLATMYDVHVNKSLVVELKSALWNGGGLGFFFFVIYGAYGLGKRIQPHLNYRASLTPLTAFNFGTTLLNRGHGT